MNMQRGTQGWNPVPDGLTRLASCGGRHIHLALWMQLGAAGVDTHFGRRCAD